MNKPPFADLGNLDEDQRIGLIGHAVMHEKKTVGVVVDDEPGKPERYIEKLQQRFPGIELRMRAPGPVKKTVTLKFAPPASPTPASN